jgi:hypothetical protein
MGFVFYDSYYSIGALCTRFTLVKIMFEWSIAQKQKKVIQNESMMHHGFPRPTSFRSTYTMKEWKDMEVANDYND